MCYKRKKNVTGQWIRNIPNIARQLEYRLHCNASSFEEYIDLSTLTSRLAEIMTDDEDIQMQNHATEKTTTKKTIISYKYYQYYHYD